MSFAVGDLSEGLGCVLLVGDLSAEEVAGLRWVRERVGRVDLAGESLIERSHRVQNRLRRRRIALNSQAVQGEPGGFPFERTARRNEERETDRLETGRLETRSLADTLLQTELRRRAAGCSASSWRRDERCTGGVSGGAHLHSLHGVIPPLLAPADAPPCGGGVT